MTGASSLPISWTHMVQILSYFAIDEKAISRMAFTYSSITRASVGSSRLLFISRMNGLATKRVEILIDPILRDGHAFWLLWSWSWIESLSQSSDHFHLSLDDVLTSLYQVILILDSDLKLFCLLREHFVLFFQSSVSWLNDLSNFSLLLIELSISLELLSLSYEVVNLLFKLLVPDLKWRKQLIFVLNCSSERIFDHTIEGHAVSESLCLCLMLFNLFK